MSNRAIKEVRGNKAHDGGILCAAVGRPLTFGGALITLISKEDDLPCGMYGNIEVVRIFAGDFLVREEPVQALQEIIYFTADELAARGEQP